MLDVQEYPNCQVKIQSRPDGFHPYDHQSMSWNRLDRHYLEKQEQRGILIIPTGGGKTSIAVRWVLRKHVSQGGRVLWLTHRRSLIRQAFATFQDCAHLLPADREYLRLIAVTGEDCAWTQVAKNHDVVLATIQTTCLPNNEAALDLMVDQTPAPGLFVIVDEAHHASAPSYQRVLKRLLDRKCKLPDRKCKLLGLTATPVRMNDVDTQVIGNTFGKKAIHSVGKEELVAQQILAEPIAETVETRCEFEKEFSEEDTAHLRQFGELSERVLKRISGSSKRNKLIVEHYLKKRDEYEKTIIFAVDTFHIQTLVDEFKRHSVSTEWIDHRRSDSAKVIEQFATTDSTPILINVEMLTEGVDIPKAKTAFLVRPTRSDALLQQMIGRVLRGPKAGGTEKAYLVDFVDTWKLFHPLNSDWVLTEGKVEQVKNEPRLRPELVVVLPELISAAYDLVRNNVQGEFLTCYSRLPLSWYVWEEEVNNDVLYRRVMVYDNQVEGFEQLERDYKLKPDHIPEAITEFWARDLVRQYFAGSVNDPLPQWLDIAELFQAWKNGSKVESYTFEEKRAFDPAVIAARICKEDLGQRARNELVQKVWETSRACQLSYHNDLKSFFEDIDSSLRELREVHIPSPGTEIEVLPPSRRSLNPWPEGEDGYLLGDIHKAVLVQNFPASGDRPNISQIQYSDRPQKGTWGFYRPSDRVVVVNRILNSPDVPRYVLEFLFYHELLHALMPNDHHNRNFRERERLFRPSPEAVEDASKRGQSKPTSAHGWAALANQFLDTLQVNLNGLKGEVPEWVK